MPRLNRLQAMQHAFKKIKDFFKEQGNAIYSESAIGGILNCNRYAWLLPNVTRIEDFMNFLIDKSIIRHCEIKLPLKTVNRYVFGDVTDYHIASSIHKDAYLCQYSAMFIHGLTQNIPKNIYINVEQKQKDVKSSPKLLQENIARAFSNAMRQTNQIGILGDTKIYSLNGKHVGKAGVIEIDFEGLQLKVTNIERTIIDITVRPVYAGGVNEVLNAYKLAKGICSVNKLMATLKELDYTYPYHQAIGFYLERAGYEEKVLKIVEKVAIKHDFYLTYQMKEKDFSDRWKLFYPKGF